MKTIITISIVLIVVKIKYKVYALCFYFVIKHSYCKLFLNKKYNNSYILLESGEIWKK